MEEGTTGRSHGEYLSERHFAGLDGLRAVAIVAVLWHHCAHPESLAIFLRGFVGVDLFFVLSGFLITTLLIRERARTGRVSLRNFWMRRILRLVPPYYLMLFGLLAAYLILKPGDPDTQRLVDGFPVYALYFSNWIDPEANNLGPMWSLATEEQFYIVWPLIEVLAAPILAGGIWIAALIVNQLINFGVVDDSIRAGFGVAPEHHPEILDTTFTPILLGVALAHVLSGARGFAISRKLAGFAHAPLVYAVLLAGLLSVPAADISGAFRLAMHVLMTLWLASLLLQPGSRVVRLLDRRPVAFIGGVSYGMYLYHMWCIHAARAAVNRLGLDFRLAELLIALPVTIAVAAASYYLFEKRFLDLRRRFRK